MRLRSAVLAPLFAFAVATSAQAIEHCRLALLLALDVSSSVDAEEYALQRDGLAAALGSDGIRAAILDGSGYVSMAIYEWSGRRQSAIVSDWVDLRDDADIDGLINALQSAPRSHTRFPTAMGYALGYGAEMLRRAPNCLYQTIDMAGDGQNNEGFGPRLAYKEFAFDDVTVNGLVVNAAEFTSETQLIDFYRNEVLWGPGAFMEVAQGFEDYERAMRRKLERELTPPVIGALSDPRQAG